MNLNRVLSGLVFFEYGVNRLKDTFFFGILFMEGTQTKIQKPEALFSRINFFSLSKTEFLDVINFPMLMVV